MGIMSIAVPDFRLAAAFSGGLYFCLAGFTHLLKVKRNKTEVFAMVTDIYIFFVLSISLILDFIN